MFRIITLLLAAAISLTSCKLVGLGKSDSTPEPSPYGPTGIPPQLRGSSDDQGTAVVAGGNSASPSSTLQYTPTKDIIYTDPDNPDAAIPELTTILSQSKRGPWEESESIAKQRAVREGKPLLIWFTDSQSSPMCKALTEELFSKNEFGDWATEKLIRLRIDDYVKITAPELSLDDAEDKRTRVLTYVSDLKKRYKVMGYPSLIMLNPSGEVVGRYRGYKRGESQFLWGQLKHAEVVSSKSHITWKGKLEKKGYREWKDPRNRQIFAKLISYSKGTLILVEPDGTRVRTHETSLSTADREWIRSQKEQRNL